MLQQGLIGALSIILLLQGAIGAQGSGGEEDVTGGLLVKFKQEATSDAIAAVQAEAGLETIKVSKRTGIHHVRILSTLTVPEAIARLQQHPAVEYAEPNYVRRLNWRRQPDGHLHGKSPVRPASEAIWVQLLVDQLATTRFGLFAEDEHLIS